ncbi:iron chelate uptake ABC transporter family permease subunit [Actinomyces slackii]|uniref:Iron-uptake system permease protein FeuC n=1 Tax=Actinomyces slackii TaxID=52774 RepID=A0A3S4SGY0_9ACTO|nr:iron chelate uptake ABC transporter family permease subunit [Actinomyces slackii]VEG75753.1 Iron-uptake system permease protein FeuC [Actinomyces slackii]
MRPPEALTRGAAPTAAPTTARMHPGVRLLIAVLLVAACAAFLLGYEARSLIAILEIRLPTLLALLIVGWAIAISTVVFQTITANRILTPSIMGLDALYALIQTLVIMMLGGEVLATVSSLTQFAAMTVIMVGASLLLIGPLLRGGREVHVLVLSGIILGTLLRSITVFLQRIMDPNEFLILQDRLFASFNGVSEELLWAGGGIVALVSGALWWRRRTLDVMLLGRPLAVSLGVDYDREMLRAMVAISVLVSVSTAMVGPITFFGLLVAHLAYRLSGSYQHAVILPMAALCAMVTLVGGQAILHHLLAWSTVLSVVIELIGGILLIILLIREGKRL